MPQHAPEIGKQCSAPCAASASAGYEALIVLGRGWRRSAARGHMAGPTPRLSMEAKMGALAAGGIFQSGCVNKIIFSGGRTAGHKHLSEACAMKQYLQDKFPQIPDDAILLEEESVDTAENAQAISRLLQYLQPGLLGLLSSAIHLRRARKLFAAHGANVHALPVEMVLPKRSPHYCHFIRKFSRSGPAFAARMREAVLAGLLLFDRKARIPPLIARKLRARGSATR